MYINFLPKHNFGHFFKLNIIIQREIIHAYLLEYCVSQLVGNPITSFTIYSRSSNIAMGNGPSPVIT